MPDDVFLQVRAIHDLLAPSRPPVVNQRPLSLHQRIKLGAVLDILLLLLAAATYLLAQLTPQPGLNVLIGLAGIVLILFVVRLVMYRLEFRQEMDGADLESHAAFVERSARELHVAQQLQAFDVKALEYVLAEYDSQFEALERFANNWLGPARVGGIIGFVVLLLGVYPALQKLAGAWTFSLLALPFGLGLGGLLGIGSLDGRRRARALLARATALKRD